MAKHRGLCVTDRTQRGPANDRLVMTWERHCDRRRGLLSDAERWPLTYAATSPVRDEWAEEVGMAEPEWVQADGYKWHRDGRSILLELDAPPPPTIITTLPASLQPPQVSPAVTRATDLLDAVDEWARAEVDACPGYGGALALRHACEALMGLAGYDAAEVLAAAELMAAAVGVEA